MGGTAPEVSGFDVKLSTVMFLAPLLIVSAPLGMVIVKVLSGSPPIEDALGSELPERVRLEPQVMLPSRFTTTVPGLVGCGTIKAKARSAVVVTPMGERIVPPPWP